MDKETEPVRLTLNRVAREQLKERVLRDILFDMTVCRLEGWNIRRGGLDKTGVSPLFDRFLPS